MIQVNGVTKLYGKETVLDNITVTFNSGLIHGLVGTNGCGKTTLMRCICGFVKPTRGEIRVAGKRIGKDADFAPRTGIIIEAPGFLPQFTGLRNLLVLADISHGADIERAREVIRLVGLDPEMKKPVGKYSLGMRQRLSIAQAIMENPDFLILDEPFNGMDKQCVADMHVLLKQWKGEGKTILLASHNSADIAQACDFVYEMQDGRIKQTAS